MSPMSSRASNIYAFDDPLSDEALLSTVSPSLVSLKELCISNVNVHENLNEEYPGRRTFISRKRHDDLTAESLSELWSIGPKRAKATLRATMQSGICSAILPLSR